MCKNSVALQIFNQELKNYFLSGGGDRCRYEGQVGIQGVTLVAVHVHGLAGWILGAPVSHGFWGLATGSMSQLWKGPGEVRRGRLARVVRHARGAHTGRQLLHGNHLRAVQHGVPPALAAPLDL